MIKKLLAIILAFFIVFSPVYSYAVLPALAAAVGSAGGRVLVGNVIHNLKKAALSKAGMAWMATGVAASAGLKSAIESDDWTIGHATGGGGSGGTWNGSPDSYVDDDGNISLDIYKLSDINYDVTCVFSLYPISSNSFSPKASDAAQYYISTESTVYNLKLPATPETVDSDAENLLGPVLSSQVTTNWSTHSNLVIPFTTSSGTRYKQIFRYCKLAPFPSNKIYMTENEFNSYLTNNTTNNNSGDMIKNIYNYDYSQHPNVTINNNTTGGTDINNDLSISADPELNVTPRLRLDLENNRVNLDNVNDTNCTKTPEGAYDNCTGEPDPEDEEETDPDDPNNPSPEDPPPIECSANGFYQKICDWMDWTKKEHTQPSDTNVDVTDKTSEIVIDNSRIAFDDQCPTPKDIDITVVGHSFSESLDYQPLCDFFTKLHPFVVGLMGGVPSAMIIAGGARRG